MKFSGTILLTMWMAVWLMACQSESDGGGTNSDGDLDDEIERLELDGSDASEGEESVEAEIESGGDADVVETDAAESYEASEVPADVPPLIDERRYDVERDIELPGPDAEQVAEFTRELVAFFKDTDYFRWLWRHSQGLPEDNEWGRPGYRVWWTNAFLIKNDGLVTLDWERPSDNSTAKVGRALAPGIALLLASDDAILRDLVLGYMRGLSANYDGMIWGDEDPVVDTIMARCIFNKSFETELDGGRRLAVNYESVRYEIEERRHDTWRNPDNPTWGDIYVRNKRSKDDFPYLYRDMPWLISLIHRTRDDELKQAAVRLLRQVRAMALDIVDHGYMIRTKDGQGEPYIPETENGQVDDFATFTGYDILFPLAECDAKLATAYLASGETLGNDCISEDVDYYGHGGAYEDVAIASHFWSSNMIWGYHVTALALAAAFDDTETAGKLLEGMAARISDLKQDERAESILEWRTDLAQLAVQAAAYGLPLDGDEALLIQQRYRAAMEHYRQTVTWDPWDASVPDDTPFSVLPDRNAYDQQGGVTDFHVRITEILNPFEYCASPLKADDGAQFVDCGLLMDMGSW